MLSSMRSNKTVKSTSEEKTLIKASTPKVIKKGTPKTTDTYSAHSNETGKKTQAFTENVKD